MSKSENLPEYMKSGLNFRDIKLAVLNFILLFDKIKLVYAVRGLVCGMRYIACRIIMYTFLSYCSFQFIHAQKITDTTNLPDSLHQLKEVSVTGFKPSVTRSTSPLQMLQGDELQKINALQVSDAVKFFSGVYVKDYGGLGGLKTVSIRSLGANHTAVAYDGIALSDYQTGQIDIGRFSLDNVEMVSLNIGETDDIFQTARMQAFAGALNIVSRKPQLGSSNKYGIQAGIKGGSFGFINPSLTYSQYLNKNFTMQLSGEWTKTNGDYPFTQTYGQGNMSVDHKRVNSDVDNWKLETNIFGKFGNSGDLSLKLYYYNSDRGLPGAVYYHRDPESGERAQDENFFIQGKYIQKLSRKIDFQANAKFNFINIDYQDISNIQPGGISKSIYFQREYYLNTTFLYTVSPRLSFSWANDGSYSNFSNNFSNCIYPSRTIWQSALSGKYSDTYMTVTANLLSTYVNEDAKKGTSQPDEYNLSPYVGLSVKPFRSLPLHLRAFYKETFRLPTFGDLYFSSVSGPGLKPESARQYNLGFTWISEVSQLFPYFSVICDFYWNEIDNRIVASAKNSMFFWSIQNIGKTETKGIDTGITLHVQTGSRLKWTLTSKYTYQNVLDKTEGSKTYNDQIEYTPHHFGSGIFGLSTPWVDLNYTLLYCGKRYFERLNREEYQMDAYTTQDVSFSRSFGLKKTNVWLSAECLNIFDKQYEVVRSYPMPGRSFRFGIKLTY